MKLIASLILGTGLVLSAQQPKPAAPVKKTPPAVDTKPTPPVINDSLKALLFKTEAQLSASQLTLEHAQKDVTEKQASFQSAVQKIQAFCGQTNNAQLDATGDPVCVAKEKEKEKETKK